MITLSKLRREHAAKVATSATATATDAADACACACDAMGRGLKSQQTLEQHLKQYHKGKMPTGDCSWLKQYKKNHPDFAKKVDGARQQLKNGVITQSEHDGKVAEIAKAESDVDTLDKKQRILKKVKTSKEAKRNAAKGGEDSKEAKIQKLVALHDEYNKWFDESDKSDKEAWLAEDHKRTEALKAAMEGLEVGKDIQWDADKKNWYALGDKEQKGYAVKDLTSFDGEPIDSRTNEDDAKAREIGAAMSQAAEAALGREYENALLVPHVYMNKDGKMCFVSGNNFKGDDTWEIDGADEEKVRGAYAKALADMGCKDVVFDSTYEEGRHDIQGYCTPPFKKLADFDNGKGSSYPNELTEDNLDYAEQPVPKDTKVKDWYAKAYPSDTEMLADMTDATFEDVLKALNGRKDVYDVMGAQDSIVRERVFQALTNSLGCEYGDIYDLWLSEDKDDGLEVKPTWTVASSSEPKYDTDKHGGPMIPSARRKEIRELQKKARELLSQANHIEAEGRKNATGWMDAAQYGQYQEILAQNYKLTQEIEKKKYDYYKEAVEAWKADKEAAGE